MVPKQKVGACCIGSTIILGKPMHTVRVISPVAMLVDIDVMSYFKTLYSGRGIRNLVAIIVEILKTCE